MRAQRTVHRELGSAVAAAGEGLTRGLHDAWHLLGSEGVVDYVRRVMTQFELAVEELTPFAFGWTVGLPEDDDAGGLPPRLRRDGRGPKLPEDPDWDDPAWCGRQSFTLPEEMDLRFPARLTALAHERATDCAALAVLMLVQSRVPLGVGVPAIAAKLLALGLRAFEREGDHMAQVVLARLVARTCNDAIEGAGLPWRMRIEPVAATGPRDPAADRDAAGASWSDDDDLTKDWEAPEDFEWDRDGDDDDAPADAARDVGAHVAAALGLLADWDELTVRELVAALNVVAQFRAFVRPDAAAGFVLDPPPETAEDEGRAPAR